MRKYLIPGVILFLIAFYATGYYYNSKDEKWQEEMYIDILENDISPIIQNGKTSLNESIKKIENANVISDVENEDFRAISKLYSIEEGNLVWMKVELLKPDIKHNIEIIDGICENMMGLAQQDIQSLIIDFKLNNSDLVNFTFFNENESFKEPMIIWSDKEYEKMYN